MFNQTDNRHLDNFYKYVIIIIDLLVYWSIKPLVINLTVLWSLLRNTWMTTDFWRADIWSRSSECKNFLYSVHVFVFDFRCSCCKENVRLTFSHTPPCLFLNVWYLRHLNVKYIPTFISVLNKIFRISTIYLCKNKHFTAWIYKPRPNLERAYYDDCNVNPLDRYSAVFDLTKEFPGNEHMVVVSYYRTEN